MPEQNAHVVRATHDLLQKLESLDFSFDVESEAMPPFDGPDIVRTAAVRRYTRTHEFDARFRADLFARLDGRSDYT